MNGGLRHLLERCCWGIYYIIHFPECLTKYNSIFGHQQHISQQMQACSTQIQEDTTLEDDSIDPFYGIAGNKPRESDNPHKHVVLGNFIIFHPPDTCIYHV